MGALLTQIRLSCTLIGLFVMVVGFWLMRAPRGSRVGLFLGPMIYFRLLGALFLLLGGLGLSHIGPFSIILK